MSRQDAFYTNFCLLKKEQALSNVPTPPRVELQPSPYNLGFTQEQLNMRRKYEILQLAVRGYGQYKRYSASALAQLATCPEPMVPTTSSDVPGPSMLLYKDPNVPIYNYLPIDPQKTLAPATTSSDYTFNGNTD